LIGINIVIINIKIKLYIKQVIANKIVKKDKMKKII